MKTLRPTTNQKKVLLKTYLSPVPSVALGETEKTINLVKARDILIELGYIRKTDDGIEITDRGVNVLKHEGLVDEDGELTDLGQRVLQESISFELLKMLD